MFKELTDLEDAVSSGNLEEIASVLSEFGSASVPEKSQPVFAAAQFILERKAEKTILVKDNDFNQFLFTQTVRVLCFYSKPEIADHLTEDCIESGFLKSQSSRVNIARNISRSVRSHIEGIQAAAKKWSLSICNLRPLPEAVVSEIPDKLTPDIRQGYYQNSWPIYTRSGSGFEEIGISPETSKILRKYAFDRPHPSTELDRISILKDAQLSAFSGQSRTIFCENGFFSAHRSGRVAKASSLSAKRSKQKTIKEALVLPFSHAQQNYYHCFYEILYGMRFVDRIDDDIPIVVGEENFGLFELITDVMGIDPQRLLRAKDNEGSLIETAYCPENGPYYWSSRVVSFFQKHFLDVTSFGTHNRIYISRQKSARSPTYEDKLASKLAEEGFLIAHLQEMSIDEQIALMKGAGTIVAHHGAGLTNILFCKSNVQIIEIFNPDFIVPDFFQRSRHITDRYWPILARAEEETASRIFSEISILLEE